MKERLDRHMNADERVMKVVRGRLKIANGKRRFIQR